MAIVGIDCGTTTSGVALHGEMIHPMMYSVADFTSGRVGDCIKREYSDSIVRNYKTSISTGAGGIKPRTATTMVLRKLREDVNALGQGTFDDAVITVPAQFGENQRVATKQAAEAAGWNAVALINEPTAAAIAYANKMGLKEQIIVFDLGGGTFDVSIVDARFGTYDVRASKGNPSLGGKDLDYRIKKYVLGNAGLILGQMTVQLYEQLEGMCEDLKIQIQKTQQDVVLDLSTFPRKDPTKEAQFTFTVNEYKALMQDCFKDTVVMTKTLIQQYLHSGDPYTLIFIGGSTRDPFLREWVEEALCHKAAPITYNQDTLVTQGASVYADMWEQGLVETLVADVTKAISIGIAGGLCDVLIPDQSKLPVIKQKPFVNSSTSDRVVLKVYQGDSGAQSNNEYLGRLVYPFEDGVREAMSTVIDVTVAIDLNGIITVTACEPAGDEVAISIERDDTQVEVARFIGSDLPFVYFDDNQGGVPIEMTLGEFQAARISGRIKAEPLTEEEIRVYVSTFDRVHEFEYLGRQVRSSVGQYNVLVALGKVSGDYLE